MNFNLNLKNVKQSAANLSAFFKSSGYVVPKSVILEGIAKVFFFKNWNTLEGTITNPVKSNYKQSNMRVIFIEINKDKDYLISLLKKASIESKCNFVISDILEKDGVFKIELDFGNTGTNNFITMWLLIAKEFKKDSSLIIKDFYFWRIESKKEDLLEILKI